MVEVYIVRHGNTFDPGDVVTRVGARTDLPLSSSGQRQAEALAEYFAQHVQDGFQLAYCSPLTRTRETAEAILSAQAGVPILSVLEFLREVDYGPDENQPEEKVIARIGEEALQAWEKEAVPPSGWQIDPEALIDAWRTLFAELATLEPNTPVLIVTSNGIARFALQALSTGRAKANTIKLKTGAFGLIELGSADPELKLWNMRPD